MNLHKLHRDLLTSQQQYDKIILDYDGIRQSKGESDITLDKPVTVYSVADKSALLEMLVKKRSEPICRKGFEAIGTPGIGKRA